MLVECNVLCHVLYYFHRVYFLHFFLRLTEKCRHGKNVCCFFVVRARYDSSCVIRTRCSSSNYYEERERKKSNIDNVSSNKTNIAACKENGDDGIFSKIKNMFVLFLSPFAAKFLIIFFVVVFSVVLCTWWFNLNLILLMEKCAVGLIHIITTVQKLFMIHISWDRLQGKRYTSTSNGILFRAAIFDFFCQSNGIGKNSKRKNPRKSSWVSK